MSRVRCTDCRRFAASTGACRAQRARIDHPRHWRCCEFYQGRQAIVEIRRALEAAELARHVAQLADTPEGRALRLAPRVPDAERFEVYRLCGLRVQAPQPLHVSRPEPGAHPPSSPNRGSNAAA